MRIALPDGSIANGDDALSDWLGRRVALRSAGRNGGSRYENVVDFEHEDASAWETFAGAAGPFHDSDGARVSLLSTATIGEWNPRRFRPNVLLDGAGEDSLIGVTVTIGEALVEIGRQIQRCVMVTRPQPDGIDRDLSVLRGIARERAACLAVGALVTHAGIVRTGDELHPQ